MQLHFKAQYIQAFIFVTKDYPDNGQQNTEKFEGAWSGFMKTNVWSKQLLKTFFNA